MRRQHHTGLTIVIGLVSVLPESTRVLCESIHQRKAKTGLRRIQGVLNLVRKYGSAACDNACAAALELVVAEYRFVRRYLERTPQAALSLKQVDPLIREMTQPHGEWVGSRSDS